MAKQKIDVQELVDRLAPAVAKAFLESIADISSEAKLYAIIAHLKANRFDLALQALNLDPAFFEPFQDAMRDAYIAGGREAMAALPAIPDPFGNTLAIRFNGRNPRAEVWLNNLSSTRVTEILEDAREAIQERLERGMIAGRNPRSVALDIVGRLDAGQTRRVGGVIGLHSRDITAADNALAQLRSGDPAQMRAYLRRKTRDKRFDAIVRQAIRDGKPVSASDANKMINRMRTILLRKRGEMVARTEMHQALHHAQNEGLDQLVDAGHLTNEQIMRTWRTARDNDVRDSHADMEGQRRQQGQPFITGNGYRMLFPGDTSLGAPASEVIHCRCGESVDIDFAPRRG